MNERRPHSIASLAALAVALVAAFSAGVFGPSTTVVAAIVLGLGVARARGARFVAPLNRPRLFAVLGVGYLIFFLIDLVLVGRANPVPSLGRLVVFLLAAEILSGDSSRAHRPILFGLLLLVSGASLTTDFWYAVPLAVFAWVATVSQLSQRLSDGVSAGAPAGAGAGAATAAAFRLTVASLVAGVLFFLAVPRVGAGWARVGARSDSEQALEAGLAPSVKLGALGRVKQRRTVAFRANIAGRIEDPEALYWRVRSYDQWTGSGWTRFDRAGEASLTLPAGSKVPIPPGHGIERPDLVATLTSVRSDFPAVPVPGRGVWARAPEPATVLASPDGTLIPAGGRPTRRMEIAVVREGGLGAPDADGGTMTPAVLDLDGIGPKVFAWARRASAGRNSARAVADALIADLAGRTYSLDTREIDPKDPVGSFLAGAPGHCEYFATALALGLRVRGVPARVAGGFLGAEPAPFGDDWVVRDSRAHLWTEAYLDGAGWVRLDATPAAGLEPVGAILPWIGAAWDSVVTTWDSWVIGLDLRDQIEALLDARDWIYAAAARIAAAPLAPIVLSGVAAALWLVARRRRRSRPPAGVPAFYARFLRAAERAGLRPERAESASEFGRRAAAALDNSADVRFVTELYERQRFGGVPADAAEQRAAAQAVGRLATGLRKPARAGSS